MKIKCWSRPHLAAVMNELDSLGYDTIEEMRDPATMLAGMSRQFPGQARPWFIYVNKDTGIYWNDSFSHFDSHTATEYFLNGVFFTKSPDCSKVKFKPTTPAESYEIQRWLFSKGYTWSGPHSTNTTAIDCGCDFLYASIPNLRITHADEDVDRPELVIEEMQFDSDDSVPMPDVPTIAQPKVVTLRSREEVDRLRAIEIMEAMLAHYHSDGTAPYEWYAELGSVIKSK